MAEKVEVTRSNEEVDHLMSCMNMYTQMSENDRSFVLGLMHGITYNSDKLPQIKVKV
jgi:hypothetical protein